MEDKYTKYAVLDAQIKVLTSQKDELKAEIIEDMAEKGEDNASTSTGKFKVVPLKTWTYTKKVYELEEEYKAQKAHEESTGDATFVEKSSLRFTPIKL